MKPKNKPIWTEVIVLMVVGDPLLAAMEVHYTRLSIECGSSFSLEQLDNHDGEEMRCVLCKDSRRATLSPVCRS